MVLHILDGGLFDLRGHYFAHISALVDAAGRLGWPREVHGRRGAMGRIGRWLPVNETFRDDLFAKPSQDPICHDLENLLVVNQRFAEDLKAGLNEHAVGAADVALLFSVTHFQTLGLADWYAGLPETARPWLAVHLRMQLQDGRGRWLSSIAPYRLAFRRLQETAGARLVLLADSEAMATEYAALTGQPVHVVPMPNPLSLNPPAPRPPRPDGVVTVGFLGDNRVQKGFGLFAQAVDLALARSDRLQVRLQCQPHPSRPPDALAGEARLRQIGPPRVVLVDGQLSDADYRALLDDLDVLALPYQREVYYGRSSGVLVEALAAGRPVIVPQNTWMQVQAEKAGAGCVAFADGDPEDLARAMIEMATTWPEPAQRSARIAPAWCAEHNPDSFLERLRALTIGTTAPM